MGSSSSSSSSNATTNQSYQYTDSYNRTLNATLGQNSSALSSAGDLNISTNLAGGSSLWYGLNSGNTTTNNADTYALGAGSSASASQSGEPGSGFDLMAFLPWILIAVAAYFAFTRT